MEIEVHNVKTLLLGFSDKDLAKVRKNLLTYAPGYRYTKLFKQRQWDGKVSLFNKQDASFPTGLLPTIVKLFPKATITDLRGITPPVLRSTQVPLRPYQWDAVNTAFRNQLLGTWWPRGVIKVATGGGKTEIAAAMAEMAPVKTLFIVHRTQLVNQAIARFKKYGINAGRIAGGELDIKKVTVATIQSLMNWRYKRKKELGPQDSMQIKGGIICSYLKEVEQVFVDEAHLTAASLDKGNMFTQALELMPNAYMRWGLTATPFMREEYHDWLLEGSTGKILYEISSRTLIDLGYLAEPKITMYKMRVTSLEDWKLDYDVCIVGNEERNKKIIECVQNRDGPIMILVQRIAHGHLLEKLCAAAGVSIRFLWGDVSVEDRENALEDLKDGTIKAVIGSTIWDEGLDVAEIRTLILAGGGKSKIKNLQRLGRGLRLSTGKKEVEVIDFFEEGSPWLRRHAVQRLRLWTDEGFNVDLQ